MPTEKIVLSWSSGKDCALALYELRQRRDFEVAGLLSVLTADYDRVSMHGVRRVLLETQAATTGLSLTEVFITAASNDDYEARIGETLARLRDSGVVGVAFGDIFLDDLRKYREEKLAAVGMKAVFPLWKRNTAEVVRNALALGFCSIVTCVDTKVLDARFAGRTIDEAFLRELPSSVDPCGENGEYHSFAFAGPVFSKEIAVRRGEVVRRGDFCFCDLLPE